MGEIIAAGARLAMGITGLAVSGVVAVSPRLSRGARPMPIDPTVQEGGGLARAGTREPEASDARARLEGHLEPTPRTA